MDFETKMVAIAASAACQECSFEDAPKLGDELQNEAQGGAFVVPLLVPEGLESGDGRTFSSDSLSSRDLPLSLLWQVKTAPGHDGSVVVGRIDTVEILPEGGLGNAKGVFDTGPYGKEAERLVRGGFLRGISADLDKFEGSVKHADQPAPDAMADDSEPEAPTEERIVADKITVSTARLMAATLTPKPAFQESVVLLADQMDAPQESDELLLGDGPYQEESDDPETVVASLAAFAAPESPPKSWFDNPSLSGPTPLTTDDDGRVYGHIATWNVHHIGLPRATPPPRSRSGYRYFQTGVLRTAEGADVPVGQLTLSGGHASMQADASAAIKHYDDTASAVADVRTGEDAFGIWVAGSLRPGITPEQVRVLRASAPSGDWRPIDGRLELVAVCQVNVPGFPVARTMVAGGQVMALVAAGARELAEMRSHPDVEEMSSRLALVEAHQIRERERERSALRSGFAALAAARGERLLARAESSRTRLRALSTARHDALTLQQETLTASAASARTRLMSLRAMGAEEPVTAPEQPAEPGLRVTPRDTAIRGKDGRYRKVLARLGDLLAGINGAEPILDTVAAAADAEDSGADAAETTSEEMAAEAGVALDALAEDITDPATKERLAEAKTVLEDPETAEAPDAEPEFATDPVEDDPTAALPADDEAAPVDVDMLVEFLASEVVGAADPAAALAKAPPGVLALLGDEEFADIAVLADALRLLIGAAIAPTPAE